MLIALLVPSSSLEESSFCRPTAAETSRLAYGPIINSASAQWTYYPTQQVTLSGTHHHTVTGGTEIPNPAWDEALVNLGDHSYPTDLSFTAHVIPANTSWSLFKKSKLRTTYQSWGYGPFDELNSQVVSVERTSVREVNTEEQYWRDQYDSTL